MGQTNNPLKNENVLTIPPRSAKISHLSGPSLLFRLYNATINPKTHNNICNSYPHNIPSVWATLKTNQEIGMNHINDKGISLKWARYIMYSKSKIRHTRNNEKYINQ
jgi:hypothetical protein